MDCFCRTLGGNYPLDTKKRLKSAVEKIPSNNSAAHNELTLLIIV